MFKTIVVFLNFLFVWFWTGASLHAKEVPLIDSLSGMIFKNRFSTYLRPGGNELSIGWGRRDEEKRLYVSFKQPESRMANLILEVSNANWTDKYYLRLSVVQVSFSSFPEALFAPSVPLPPDSVRYLVEQLRNELGTVVGSTILVSPDSVAKKIIIIPIRPSLSDNTLWQFSLVGDLVPEDPENPHYGYSFCILRFRSVRLIENSSDLKNTQINKKSWGQIKSGK